MFARGVLLPEDPSRQSFRGFISAGGDEYHLQLVREKNSSWRVLPDAELAVLFHGLEKVVERKVLQCKDDVDELVVELVELAEKVKQQQHVTGGVKRQRRMPMRDAAFYTRLVAELDDETLEVAGIGERLDEIKLRTLDAAGREHLVRVVLPLDYPTSAPVCFADLPFALEISGWDSSGSSGLKHIHRQFVDAVARFQPFWNTLDELDARTWVLLDSGVPSRASGSRRIVVQAHCYLQIVVDPLAPLRLPEIRFLGSDALIAPLKAKLNHSAQNWDLTQSLLVNLQKCFGISFPQPSAAQKQAETHANSCGICYEFHHEDDAVPDVICANSRCQKSFHRQCLYDWLRSIPSTKQSFSTLFGECPFCSHGLSFAMK